MTVEEVLAVVERDRNLYRKSGGGLTVSGGEPLYQSRFLRRLLSEAKKRWLNTAIESCGFAKPQAYEEVLPYVDFMFLDIKVMNDIEHREWAGQSNALVLRNVRRIAEIMHERNKPLVIRTPLVPGYTMTETNIREIAAFVSALPGVSAYELIPYHRLGRGKYSSLGKEYPLEDVIPPKKEDIAPLQRIVTEFGLISKWN